MYAAGYTPPIAGVKTAPGTVLDPEMQDAANTFEKMYPGINDQVRAGTALVRQPSMVRLRGRRR